MIKINFYSNAKFIFKIMCKSLRSADPCWVSNLKRYNKARQFSVFQVCRKCLLLLLAVSISSTFGKSRAVLADIEVIAMFPQAVPTSMVFSRITTFLSNWIIYEHGFSLSVEMYFSCSCLPQSSNSTEIKRHILPHEQLQ
jgi:hypothetical protein